MANMCKIFFVHICQTFKEKNEIHAWYFLPFFIKKILSSMSNSCKPKAPGVYLPKPEAEPNPKA